MSVTPGTRLGVYQITAAIGEGGMGQVSRARDTPVAQLIPVREPRALRVRKPAPGAPPLQRIKIPKRARLSVEIVELLLEERQGHR